MRTLRRILGLGKGKREIGYHETACSDDATDSAQGNDEQSVAQLQSRFGVLDIHATSRRGSQARHSLEHTSQEECGNQAHEPDTVEQANHTNDINRSSSVGDQSHQPSTTQSDDNDAAVVPTASAASPAHQVPSASPPSEDDRDLVPSQNIEYPVLPFELTPETLQRGDDARAEQDLALTPQEQLAMRRSSSPFASSINSSSSANHQHVNFTFTLLKSPTEKPNEDLSVLEIKSAGLKKLLSEALIPQPSAIFAESPLRIPAPYKPFVHSWKKLEKAAIVQGSDDKSMVETRRQLTRLLHKVRTSSALEPYFRFKDTHRRNQLITAEWLWTIFPAGSLVCTQSFLHHEQIFEVQRIDDDAGEVKGFKGHTVTATAYDWDGERFERFTYKFSIPDFKGPRPISSLPCFPIHYHIDDQGNNDHVVFKARMIDQGHRFVDYCAGEGRKNGFQCDYNGVGISNSYTLTNVQGKVIVDHLSFLESWHQAISDDRPPLGEWLPQTCPSSSCECTPCRQIYKEAPNEMVDAEHFAESSERLVLCPPRVLGYALSERKWCQFGIGDILELPEGTNEPPDLKWTKRVGGLSK